MKNRPLIVLKDVCKTFHGVPILDHLSITMEKGDVVGLAGGSGSGKTTLLRCIQGLDHLDSGYITVQGKTGFMFQDFQLFPHMTVMENIMYAAHFLTNPHWNLKDHGEYLLSCLGLGDKKKMLPHRLSGGQKQRVALARSLMLKPDVVLCDEPTSGLDVGTVQDVIALFSSMNDLGTTFILASHDLNFLCQIARRIIVLKKGHLALDIDPSSMENPVSFLQKSYGNDKDANETCITRLSNFE